MRFASTGSRGASRRLRSTDAGSFGARTGEAGFTLLETLVALAILAIALVSLYQAHAQGVRATSAASAYAEARILAQALLADALSPRGKAPVRRDGHEGRFVWAVNVAPETAGWAQITTKEKGREGSDAFAASANAGEREKTWRMYRVRVTVSWDKNRAIALNTLKLGAAP